MRRQPYHTVTANRRHNLPTRRNSRLDINTHPLGNRILNIARCKTQVFTLLVLGLTARRLDRFAENRNSVDLRRRNLQDRTTLLIVYNSIGDRAVRNVNVNVEARDLSTGRHRPSFYSMA